MKYGKLEIAFLIILALTWVICIFSLTTKENNNEVEIEIYECEITTWNVGQGYENHNIDNVLEWELDKYNKEMYIKSTSIEVYINADDIDYICHTQD